MGYLSWHLNLFPVPEGPVPGPSDYDALTLAATVEDKECQYSAKFYIDEHTFTKRCISPIEGL